MLQQFADWVTYTVLGLIPGTPLASSVNFFIYDSIKVTLSSRSSSFLWGSSGPSSPRRK